MPSLRSRVFWWIEPAWYQGIAGVSVRRDPTVAAARCLGFARRKRV
jgi:hypothetical protein